MELGSIVGKRLFTQVVFVPHFSWSYIPSVKKNVLQDGIAVSEGISRIARELQIVAGKILSFICCCLLHRQCAALRGSSCRPAACDYVSIVNPYVDARVSVYENVCFPLAGKCSSILLLYLRRPTNLLSLARITKLSFMFSFVIFVAT